MHVALEPNVSWFAMECLVGWSMDRVINIDCHGPINNSDGIALAQNILAALMVMRAEGLVHRDIKPSNIMCGKDL